MIHLLKSNWHFDVSSIAASDLNMKKWNKITIIPLASDLRILKDYLTRRSQNAAEKLVTRKDDLGAYKLLLETIFCKVILLNRRRPGELQRLPVSTYLNSSSQKNYEEFHDAITPTERVLIKTFKRIVIRGKRGRGVPVLFSQDVQEQVELLLSAREDMFKDVSNPYLFGWPGSSTPLVGYKVLEKHAKASGAKNPEAITATRLRKHLATITQIFNMTDTDIEQLANFMGHTDKVHRGEYRLPDDVYQTAKICKLLLTMENGSAGKFKGKTLEEIDVDMDEDLFNPNISLHEGNPKDDEYDDIFDDPDYDTTENKKDIQETKSKQKRELTPWTKNQKEIVLEYFKNHIKTCTPPRKAECMKLIKQYSPELENKSWLKIKVFVQNAYMKKQKRK